MKTKSLFVCVVLATLLLSACIPSQAPGATTLQPLLPTALPIAEPTDAEPTTVRPTPTYTSGPEVVQFGDLTMEIYERVLNTFPRDDSDAGYFSTTAGPSTKILKTRRPLRDVLLRPFSPPPLNGHQLTFQRTYVQNQSGDGITASFENVTVTFKLGDEEVLSVNCGVGGPVDPLRGMWVIGRDWYAEVAHVELETDGNGVKVITRGEIFVNGVSLNEQFGYDETFGFQPLDDKPFFFFAQDGQIGINYAGETYQLGFESISHYACCSAGFFNPKAYLTMVTFFAQSGVRKYYVELGLFE